MEPIRSTPSLEVFSSHRAKCQFRLFVLDLLDSRLEFVEGSYWKDAYFLISTSY